MESGYPSESRYKLLERRAKCLLHLGRAGEAGCSLDDAIGGLNPSPLKYGQFNLTLSEALKSTKLNDLESNKIIANIEKEKKNLPKKTCDQTDKTMAKMLRGSPSSIARPNPQVPAFEDSVRIEYDEVRGRYGVATRDLMPGEVILQVMLASDWPLVIHPSL